MIQPHSLGAVAANIAALCFLTGFALYFTLLAEPGYPLIDQDPAPQIRFMIAHANILTVWYHIIYLLFGFSLMILISVLQQKFRTSSPLLAQLSLLTGLVWVVLVIASGLIATLGMQHVLEISARNGDQAQVVWLSVQILLNALGGGNEIVGGLWLILTNVLLWLQTSAARLLLMLGVCSGLAGLLTSLPALQPLGAVFGIGCMIWFSGLSLHLLNQDPD